MRLLQGMRTNNASGKTRRKAVDFIPPKPAGIAHCALSDRESAPKWAGGVAAFGGSIASEHSGFFFSLPACSSALLPPSAKGQRPRPGRQSPISWARELGGLGRLGRGRGGGSPDAQAPCPKVQLAPRAADSAGRRSTSYLVSAAQCEV